MILLLKFFFYSGLIIPTTIALIDKLINNNFFLFKFYAVNIINIYFIMLVYVFAYFTVLRRVKIIKEFIEGS
jgi:hypothetical protein